TILRAVALAVCLVPAVTMKAGLGQDRSAERLSIVEDWTSRHVIFSGARSGDQARKMTADSRYRQQWLRRNRPAFAGQDSLQALVQGVREVAARAGSGAKAPRQPKK